MGKSAGGPTHHNPPPRNRATAGTLFGRADGRRSPCHRAPQKTQQQPRALRTAASVTPPLLPKSTAAPLPPPMGESYSAGGSEVAGMRFILRTKGPGICQCKKRRS